MKLTSLKQIKYITSHAYCKRHHPAHIDYSRVDTRGSPSLCCSVCTTKHRDSKYYGKPKYIQFISSRAVERLLEAGVELDVRGL
jgi:hypothetical protein